MGVSYSFLSNYGAGGGNKRRLELDCGQNESTSSDAVANNRDVVGPPVRKKLRTTEYIYKRLFLNGEGSDVTICALGRDWRLHKVYLGQSLYFSSMFNGNWKESKENRIVLDIPDRNITVKSLDLVFASLYRDDVTIDPRQVISLLAASTLLQLDSVVQQCSEVMADNLNVKTVLSFYQAAETYGICELKEICIDWLEKNLLFYSSNSALLKEIWPELMEKLISSPNLLVFQGEMDAYILLKKWIYLRLNPRCKKSSGALKLAADDYFLSWQEKESGFFALSEEGERFLPVLKQLRLGHMISSSKTINSLLADRIIPENVLTAVMAVQWRKLLLMEATFDLPFEAFGLSPVYQFDSLMLAQSLSMSEDEFFQRCVRCGRVLSTDSPYCWRWSGYNFGVDILLCYKHRMLSIKRNVSSQCCPYSINMKPSRHIYYRLFVLSFNTERKILWSEDSGVQRISLQLDESQLLMRIPSKVEFPLSVIFYYVVAPELGSWPEEGRFEKEWAAS